MSRRFLGQQAATVLADPDGQLPAVGMRVLREEFNRPARYGWATLGVLAAGGSGLLLAVALTLLVDASAGATAVGLAIALLGLALLLGGLWLARECWRTGSAVLHGFGVLAASPGAPTAAPTTMLRAQVGTGALVRAALAGLSLLAAVFGTAFVALAASGRLDEGGTATWTMLPLGLPMAVVGAVACVVLLGGELRYQRVVSGQVVRGRQA